MKVLFDTFALGPFVFQENWGSMRSKEPSFGRVDNFQTSLGEKCGEAYGYGKVKPMEMTRLISSGLATNFERGSIMAGTVDGTFNLEQELALTEKEEQAELERAKALPIAF